MSTWRPLPKTPKWMAWMPPWLRTIVKVSFWLAGSGFLLVFLVALYFFASASRFDLAEVSRIASRTTYLDRHGKEMNLGGPDNRKLVTRQDIPDFLVKALRAREDARFFEHGGVDLRGLLRATYRNVRDRDFTQGASTLSMQLARNTYGEDDPALRGKTIHRKLLEIALTLRIESRYSKDEILTHYLNRIYFGSGCHGVEQAARTYFGKSTSELNEAECSMIVGIIRGPHIFSPLRNLDAAREQQSQTLQRMKAMDFIDDDELARIRDIPIVLARDDERSPERSYAHEAIRRELNRILDDADIRADGLIVRTTLDSAWQARLEDDLSASLSRFESLPSWKHPTLAKHTPGAEPAYVQCAAVTLETKTGGILALIGGRSFADSRFDRTISARRDLGGAFEPWVAAAAAERGRLVLPGKPVQTGRQIGPAATARIAKRCGITGPFSSTEDLFRGIAAATPREVAIGLATLGNQGKRPSPYFIESISTAEGKELYRANPSLSAAIQPRAARQAAALLSSSSGTRIHDGATGSGRDAWLLRLGPKGSTAIWVGFDQPQRISSSQQLDRILDDLGKRLGN